MTDAELARELAGALHHWLKRVALGPLSDEERGQLEADAALARRVLETPAP